MSLITSEDRDAYLRTKNKFYVAGWVAAEGQEKAGTGMPEPGAFWRRETYYESYQNGYGDCVANGECLANNNSGG